MKKILSIMSIIFLAMLLIKSGPGKESEDLDPEKIKKKSLLYNHHYFAKKDESINSVLKRNFIISSDMLKNRCFLRKIKEWNPHIYKWKKMALGTRINFKLPALGRRAFRAQEELSIDIDVLEKIAIDKIITPNEVAILKKELPKEKKVKKKKRRKKKKKSLRKRLQSIWKEVDEIFSE